MNTTMSDGEQPSMPDASPVDEESINAIGKVESKIPGRMRVRLKPELRTPEATARLQQALEANPDVKDVNINQRTGSVAFTHETKKDGHSILSSVIGDAELLTEVVFDLPSDDDDGEDAYGKFDQQLANIMYQTEYAVYKKTGLHFRGQVVAGSLAALGVAQMAVYGISLQTLPGPLLIWVAWDIYHRVAQEPPFPDETDANAEPAASGVVTPQEATSAI